MRVEIIKPETAPLGIAALVHGLNLKSSRMDDIARLWLERGYIVAKLTLSGHESAAHRTEPSRAAWLSNFKDLEIEIARLKGEHGDLHCICVAMSLGALMFVDHVFTNNSSTFTKAFFLAPAIQIRRRSQILKGPSRILPGLRLKSFSEPDYRVHGSLPLAFYRELYEAYDAVQASLRLKVFPIPTQIFSHPKDEMVSHRRLVRLAQKVESFSLLTFLDEPSLGFNHLMIDEKTMGEKNWRLFTSQLFEGV